MAGSDTLRETIRQQFKSGQIQPPKEWRNPADYDRSDLTREQRMRHRLIADSIADGGADYRDDLMEIAYCYHNLSLLGIDADKVFVELAHKSAPAFAKLLVGFIERSPADKSMDAWRLEIRHTNDRPAAVFR
jgi:hypothetical protein